MYLSIVKFIKKKIFSSTISKIFYSIYLAIKIEIKLFFENNIILVYDCKNTPPTYGDFSYFIFLLRFLIAKNKRVKFFIIKGEYRHDWSIIDQKRKNNFIKELSEIAKYYTSKKIVFVTSWNKFENILENKKKQILFLNKTRKRIKFYNHIFNTLQILYFLNKKIWHQVKIKYKTKNYFGIHFRYQIKSSLFKKKYSSLQNSNFKEAKKIVNFLIKLHPSLTCIIFTNEDGHRYFKNLNKISKKIKFSKEISKSFLKDVKILSECKYYYAYKGGGIGVFVKFTDINYYIGHENLGNEFLWKKNKFKLAAWSLDSQKLIIDEKITANKYLTFVKEKNYNF